MLLYHAVGTRSHEADPFNLFVPPDAFEAQLRALRGAGWTFLDGDAWLTGLERGRWPRRSVLVTFDDGYESTLSGAAPLLRRHGVPAVVFVCSGLLGGTSEWMTETREPLLDAQGVRALAAAGLEVGAHGVDHRSMVGLGPAELAEQVAGPRRALADVLGVAPRLLAYPFGDHDAAARDAAASAGFRAAFATYTGGSGRFAVTRVDVNALDTPRTFRLKTLRPYPFVRRHAGRAPAARAVMHSVVGKASRSG